MTPGAKKTPQMNKVSLNEAERQVGLQMADFATPTTATSHVAHEQPGGGYRKVLDELVLSGAHKVLVSALEAEARGDAVTQIGDGLLLAGLDDWFYAGTPWLEVFVLLSAHLEAIHGGRRGTQ